MHHTNEDFRSSSFPERIASLTATTASLMSLSLLSMICSLSVSTKGKTVQYKNSTTQEALLWQTDRATRYFSRNLVNCCRTVGTSCTTNPQ